MDDMAAAHSRDYADKAKVDMLSAVIRDFLDDPPSSYRIHEKSLVVLRTLADELEGMSAHIVRVWD
jgi:hypothetical protein